MNVIIICVHLRALRLKTLGKHKISSFGAAKYIVGRTFESNQTITKVLLRFRHPPRNQPPLHDAQMLDNHYGTNL
jgi:hypothetical protein